MAKTTISAETNYSVLETIFELEQSKVEEVYGLLIQTIRNILTSDSDGLSKLLLRLNKLKVVTENANKAITNAKEAGRNAYEILLSEPDELAKFMIQLGKANRSVFLDSDAFSELLLGGEISSEYAQKATESRRILLENEEIVSENKKIISENKKSYDISNIFLNIYREYISGALEKDYPLFDSRKDGIIYEKFAKSMWHYRFH